MKLLIIAAAIALIICLVPYIRVFFKRLKLAGELSKLCRSGKVRLHKNHALWLFGTRRGKDCDFYLETGDTIWSVKLFGVKTHHSELNLTDDGKYFMREYIAFAAGMFSRIPLDSKKHELAVDFRADFNDDWYSKLFKPVLLVNPICMQINYSTKTESRVIGAGEIVNEMYIYSLSRLISDIKSEVG